MTKNAEIQERKSAINAAIAESTRALQDSDFVRAQQLLEAAAHGCKQCQNIEPEQEQPAPRSRGVSWLASLVGE